MRQAGRYMPSYRAIREKHSFLQMCQRPDVATEVTLLPIRELGTDAAILFADILLILDALGRGLRFVEGVGPVLELPLQDPANLPALAKINVREELGYVAEAVRNLRQELSVPLIGFAGAPFTVASYLIEGQSSRDLKRTKQWMLREPDSFHQLLQHITDLTIDYLQMQIDAGAQAVQLFDSWANTLSGPHFRDVCLPYHRQIVEALRPNAVPIILFCRGSSVFAQDMAGAEPDALSIDWQADLVRLRAQLGPKIALQGNLDPHILYAPIPTIQKEARRILEEMEGDPGFIFNLGHGLLPDMEVSRVKALVDTVQSFEAAGVGG
jgi:uroporphyrinogen decarboxylase